MLARGTPAAHVAKWINERDPDANISRKTAWIHNKRHRLPTPAEIETNIISARETKPVKPPVSNLPQATDQAATDAQKNPLIRPVNETLRLIINKVTERIETGNLEPTVPDAIKAAELLNKSNETPFTDAICAFFMKVGQATHDKS